MPGSSKHFGPPRRYVDSIADLDADECSNVEKLKDARIVQHELPRLDGHPELEREIKQRFLIVEDRGQNLYELKNARILGASYLHPLITNKDRFVLDQAAHELEQGRHPAHYALKLPRITNVKGRTFSLVSRWSDNYWHWLFDCIGKILLLPEGGEGSVPLIDFYAGLNIEDYRFKKESLIAAGISFDQIIDILPLDQYLFEHLYVANVPSSNAMPEMDLVNALRIKFLPKTSRDYTKNSRRIYVSRGKCVNRIESNEWELDDLLKQYGFEKVHLEDMSFLGQVELFHSASVILSQHGAGLTNIVFAQKGTMIIEIFEPEFVNPCYAFLCKKTGLDYKMLFNAKNSNIKLGGPWLNIPKYVEIDIPKLRAALSALLKGRH